MDRRLVRQMFGQGRDEMRMVVAERIHRHARREVEIALAIGRDQPNALAALEREVDACVGRQQV